MDKPSAFKNWINENVAQKWATGIVQEYPSFKVKKFLILLNELEELELKERVLLITRHLELNLKLEYPEALRVLLNVMERNDMKGFELWPLSEFISQFGLGHFDLSLKAMYQLTERFTSEFAVRAFILKDHKRVLKNFDKWTTDKSVHVRRWVSEGSRPLLPWGQKIPLFIMDPTHTLLILDKLKFDEELYVRKSVANHLNDISKNHPQVVIEILRLWLKDAPPEHRAKIDWIKRHALRTLIKKGHPGALKLMGVSDKPIVSLKKISLDKKTYKLSDVLHLSIDLVSGGKKPQKLIVDYAIDFMKANGKKGKKVFKLKTFELGAGERITLKKKHSLKPITTMKYYAGTHHLLIQVNGEVMGEVEFDLKT